MLKDFCALLPELYGEEHCTMNAHLLLHLTHYVRLWGPLWTHSAFGCENKNGIIKNLSHSKNKVLNQIIFNIEVQQTLQLVHHKLVEQEDADAINFINDSSRFMPSEFEELGKHMYTIPTSFMQNVEGYDLYGKLLLNGTLYYAQNCSRSTKRESSVCYYKENESTHYGRIIAFVKMDPPSAIVRPFSVTQSLLSKAGPACRDVLQVYKDEDILTWLKKKLSQLGLRRLETHLPLLFQAIRNELQTSNRLLGYRSMWKLIQTKYGYTVKSCASR
ncbi:hypothetical protein EMCRGX_G013849 [Ephydatia muelleri]